MDLSVYRHLIWDWNGTLLDDAWLCRDIMNGQLRKRGLPTLSAERYEAIFDFPVEGYYRKVGFDWRKESFEEAGTEFIVEYEKRKTECRLQIGAQELLKRVESAGQALRDLVLHGIRRERTCTSTRCFCVSRLSLDLCAFVVSSVLL
jgi:phosphoglycolate phosphatase